MIRNDHITKRKTALVAQLGRYILIRTRITAWHKCKNTIQVTLSNALMCQLPIKMDVEKGDVVYSIIDRYGDVTLYHNVNGHIIKIKPDEKQVFHFAIKPFLGWLIIRMIFKF